jgi:nitrogen regulatory protein P-II 1
MKLVTAIVKPFRLDEVKDALRDAGVDGLTITESQGAGLERLRPDGQPAAIFSGGLVPKIRIEVVVDDELAERAVSAIMTAARTGTMGDGKIWVTDAAQVYRIRTGQVGAEAV